MAYLRVETLRVPTRKRQSRPGNNSETSVLAGEGLIFYILNFLFGNNNGRLPLLWLYRIQKNMITLIILLITFIKVLRLKRSDPSPDVTMGDVLKHEFTKILYKKTGRGGWAYVRSVLKRLGPEYTVFNDLVLRQEGHEEHIDHLVLSPYGLFVIETKDDDGRVYGSEQAEQWKQCKGKSERPMDNPVQQNEAHVRALRQVLGEHPYIPIVAFVGDADLNVTAEHAVIAGCYELISTIHAYREVRLTPERVQELAARLTPAEGGEA